MKRSLTVLAGMILVLGAAACSKDNSTPAPATSTSVKASVSATSTTTAPHDRPSTTVPAPAPTTDRRGADGSTGNGLSAEYCAKNQDPGCPRGSYIGPNAIPNPNGDGTWVPCEGSICTNPNHGAGPETTPPPVETTTPPVETTTPPPNNDRVEGGACEGDGHWVHLDGGNAGHYGTDWLCRH
ncbi:hypothetical protein D7D52_33825 [Nocardia yunnanensis]|uniref:Lipoprotein n=1 Tax=Nocardia yunnanensis TaxID=2382165 RepID=A0A386ZKJ9_9NOCA|nr:hypothetical protein D7D52_33825 [Nocardia yunnanensis]